MRTLDERKAARRRTRLKQKYALSPEAWEVLFESQGRRCGCCAATTSGGKNGWQTDHDHRTGRVRGILCVPCNLQLGMLERANLSQLRAYLERQAA
ncbi:MAG TPA: endonuclease domain-containing protein [Thermoplasmata archaeon]